MADRRHIAFKVRTYLEGLSPAALNMLMRGLETAREHGTEDPQSGLILDTARSLLRRPETDGDPETYRGNVLKRAFFKPLEPFLISEVLEEKLPGRIHRPSLDAIWLWLERDIAPEPIAKLQKALLKAEYKERAVDAAVAKLRSKLLDEMKATLEEAADGGLAHQKIAYRVGGDNILAELEDIHGILTHADALAGFVQALPDSLDAVDLKTDELLLVQGTKFIDDDPLRAAWLAALFLPRAEDPAWLVSYAARAARSSRATLIHRSPYRPLVEILLSELHRLTRAAEQARGNPLRGDHMVDCIRRYADLMRDISIETTLDDVLEWRERLAQIRSDMAAFLNKTLASLLADLRRVLQVPPVGEDGRFTQDRTAVADVRHLLEVLVIARHNGEALAVNDLANRLHHSVEQVLDISSRALLDKVRDTTGDHRRACLATANAAIEFCEVAISEDYARTLRSRRDKLCEGIDLATADTDGLFADAPSLVRAKAAAG